MLVCTMHIIMHCMSTLSIHNESTDSTVVYNAVFLSGE